MPKQLRDCAMIVKLRGDIRPRPLNTVVSWDASCNQVVSWDVPVSQVLSWGGDVKVLRPAPMPPVCGFEEGGGGGGRMGRTERYYIPLPG